MTPEMREKIRLHQIEKLKAIPYVVVMESESPPIENSPVKAEVKSEPAPRKERCGCGRG